MSHSHLAPLARWDGLHLVLDLPLIESHLRWLLRHVEHVSELAIAGRGDVLVISGRVLWKGVRARIAVDVGEVRFRHRHLGFRVLRVRAPGRVRVPRAAIEAILDGMDTQLVTVMRGQGIVVIDLRRWIPPEVTLRVLTVQATERSLHLWLGPGELHDLPRAPHPQLAPGTAIDPEVAEKA